MEDLNSNGTDIDEILKSLTQEERDRYLEKGFLVGEGYIIQLRPDESEELVKLIPISPEEIAKQKKRSLKRLISEFQKKNDLFRFGYQRGLSPFEWHELDLPAFLDEMFIRGDSLTDPFEELQSAEYKYWRKQYDNHEPIDYKHHYTCWRYNPIVVYATGKRIEVKLKKSNTGEKIEKAEMKHKILLKDDMETLNWLQGRQFAIMPPATFVGRNNTNRNGRFLYAIGIDLDEVEYNEIMGLFSNCSTQISYMNHVICPVPNIITNSGHGIHIYYLLKEPVALVDENTWKLMQRIKDNMTLLVWQENTSMLTKKDVQMQPILQGFRLPGTLTKFGEKITSWENLDSHLYTLEELNHYSSDERKLSKKELESIGKYKYNPNRVTRLEAAKLWPEWYHNRVVLKKRVNKSWEVNKAVYDWWMHKLREVDKNVVGHRFWCVMILFIYGAKCKVPFDDVMTDAKSLLESFESLTKYSDDDNNHFTIEDILKASEAYGEDYNKFPLKKIESLSGFRIERTIRKGRMQKDHIKRISVLRDMDYPNGCWRNNNGRPVGSIVKAENSKMASIVAVWRKNNPDNKNKSLCAKETGLSRPTVRKWWNESNL